MEFLIAILASIVVALIALSEKMTAKEILISALPAWVQALAAVAAIWFALTAYRQWSRQESAKRRAEAAERILAAAYSTAYGIRDARLVMPFGKGLSNEQFIEFAAKLLAQRAPLLDGSAATAGALRSLESTARMYFGADAETEVRQIYYTRLVLQNALKFAIDREANSIFGEDFMLQQMAIIGLKPDQVSDGVDDHEKALAARLQRLDDLLTPFATYGHSTR